MDFNIPLDKPMLFALYLLHKKKYTEDKTSSNTIYSFILQSTNIHFFINFNGLTFPWVTVTAFTQLPIFQLHTLNV